MPLDYGAILAAGQQLVPDMRQQVLDKMRLDAWRSQIALQQRATQQKLDREKAFEEARVRVMTGGGKPQDIQGLMLQFPEYANEIKPVWEAMDKDHRTSDLTQIGSIYARGNAGDYAGAAAILRRRVEADRAAGQPDQRDEAILTALESGTEQEKRAAVAEVGINLAAVEPDKFAETYGKLNPTDAKTAIQREYDWRVGQFGQEAADRWLTTKDTELLAVEPGGSVYNKADFARPNATPSFNGGIVETRDQREQREGLEARFPEMAGMTPPDQPKRGDQSAGGEVSGYAMPVEGGTFTSGIGAARPGGRVHNGQDIAAPAGTPIVPIAPGTVVGVGSDKLSGNFVKVRHGDGTVSSYAHMGSVGVKPGQQVGPGVQLGTVGATGNATGNVLHLRIRDRSGRNIDPRAALNGAGKRPIQSRQQWEKLPKGARYLAPDGSIRVKR